MIEALGTKLIIEKVVEEQKSRGGLYLSMSEDPNPKARVLSVGPEVKGNINPEDLLYVEWRNTAPIKHDGKDYHVIDETSLYGRTL
jgi:co-chaperonin GroES (HSP10)